MTKCAILGYNDQDMTKAAKRRVFRPEPDREPCLLKMGTGKAEEHGLGAGFSTGREPRVRPVTGV